MFFWHFQQFNLVWKIQNSSWSMKPQPSAIFLSGGIRSLEPKSHIVATCEDKKRPIQNPSGVCGMEWQWCCCTLDISGYFINLCIFILFWFAWFLVILSSLIYFLQFDGVFCHFSAAVWVQGGRFLTWWSQSLRPFPRSVAPVLRSRAAPGNGFDIFDLGPWPPQPPSPVSARWTSTGTPGTVP